MNEIKSFKRYPAVHCWIKHILEGVYSAEDKSFFMIFGKVKRVRIVATIVAKREILITKNKEEGDTFEDLEDSNVRIEFDLDDSTGLIRATIWGANPDEYKEYTSGDIVDIVGLLRRYGEYTSISPEIIKKIDNPNFILLRNAEIIKKIKDGDVQEISRGANDIDEIGGEIDVDTLFESNEGQPGDSIKDTIFTIIEEHSLEGNGISFEEIKKRIKLSDEDLRKHIKDLVMESKIYQSDKNIYESY